MKHTFTLTEGKTESAGNKLTFLANSGTRMVNGYTVDLETLKAPLEDGSLKLVKDLTESDKLTLPLLIDHMPSVFNQAGTVTKLWLDNDGLMAEAVLSDVENGRLVKQLAQDGALTNSFSITVEVPHTPEEDGVLKAGELVEISVVYRGADSKAAFRSLNSRNGQNMNDIKHIIEKFNLSQEEADKLISALTEALQTTLDASIQAVDNLTEDNTTEDNNNTENKNETAEPEQPQQSTNSKDKAVNHTVIINSAGAANGNAIVKNTRNTWIDSNEALYEFEKTFREADNKGVEAFKRNWAETVREHMSGTVSNGIEEADVSKLIPTVAVTTIQDALNTAGTGIWSSLKKTGLDQLTIGANIAGLTDDTRAHGYGVSSYGTKKKEQNIALVKREISADYTYKFITLNKGDIRRTQTPGALIKYVLSELPNYIIQTIERQITLGGYTDMAHFRSVVTDAADSSSDWAGNKFSINVTASESEALLYTFFNAAHKVTANGEKILITNADTIVNLMLSLDATGKTLIPLGDEGLAKYLGVSKIITPSWWTSADDANTLGVVLSPSNYSVVGDTSIEAFTNFALSTNTNEYLQELYAGGALSAEKSAAVIAPAGK